MTNSETSGFTCDQLYDEASNDISHYLKEVQKRYFLYWFKVIVADKLPL